MLFSRASRSAPDPTDIYRTIRTAKSQNLVASTEVHTAWSSFNHLTPNDHFSGRTAPLTSRCCILYIYSTNIRTEYFKHAAHSLFFPRQNAVYFIMLPFFRSCIIHILNTGCAKI